MLTAHRLRRPLLHSVRAFANKEKKPWDIKIDSDVDTGKTPAFSKVTNYLTGLFTKKPETEETKAEAPVREAY